MGVDNDAARAALINATSSAPALREVVKRVAYLNATSPSYRWVLRVPSKSNLADAPSRGELAELERLGAVRHRLDWERVRAWAVSRV